MAEAGITKTKKTSRNTDMVVAAPASRPASHRLINAMCTKEGSAGKINEDEPQMQPENPAPIIKNRQSEL